jgi:hypothetical protein
VVEIDSIRKRRHMLSLQSVPLMRRRKLRLWIPITVGLLGAALIAGSVFLFPGRDATPAKPVEVAPVVKKAASRVRTTKPAAAAKKTVARKSPARR